MVSTAVVSVFDPTLGTKGDLDEDGAINIFDLLELLKILSGKVPAPVEEKLAFAADLDSSDKVDLFDLLALLQVLSNSG